jgi:6-phosphogluconolactonase (cycloisomerase 2 family)
VLFGQVSIAAADAGPPYSIAPYAIAPATGLPYEQQPGSPFATGAAPVAVAFSPNRPFLATADYVGGDISMFSWNSAAAALAGVTGSPFATGLGPDAIAFSPSGSLLAATNLVGSTVSVFSVASDGALAQVGGSPFPAGNGPRSIAFSPTGNLLATANSYDNTVTLFRVEPSTGALTTLTGSPFATGADPLSVQFSPNGHFLAVANHNDDMVSVFSVDPTTGVLTPVGGSPFATGAGPSSLAFNPNDTLLATANTDDNTASVFSFDGSTGGLHEVAGSPYPTDASPIAVAFSASGGLLATANFAAGDVSLFVVDPATGALAPETGSPYRTGNQPHGIAFPSQGNDFAVVNRADSTVSIMGPAPPVATITKPQSGGTYKWHAKVRTAFSCADAPGGPGVQSCRDSHGRRGGVGSLYTSSGGTFTYSVTAVSLDGLSGKASIMYTVLGPPTQLAAPAIMGTAVPGHQLTCTNGTWTGRPTAFTRQWSRDGVPIQGATHPTYTVQTLDEGSTLGCRVAARNKYGVGREEDGRAPLTGHLRVPVAHVRGCPAARGRLTGATLGPVRLGEARGQVRHALQGSKLQGASHTDSFCVTPGDIRVGYPSPQVMAALPPRVASQVSGRAIWIATSNPTYVVDQAAVAARLQSAKKRLPRGATLHVGADNVYLVGRGATTLVLDSRNGSVVQIGVASSGLIATQRARLALLSSLV